MNSTVPRQQKIVTVSCPPGAPSPLCSSSSGQTTAAAVAGQSNQGTMARFCGAVESLAAKPNDHHAIVYLFLCGLLSVTRVLRLQVRDKDSEIQVCGCAVALTLI
jgi:hypothetical protein